MIRVPESGTLSCVASVITHSFPPFSTKYMAALTFGAMLPSAKRPSAKYCFASAHVILSSFFYHKVLKLIHILGTSVRIKKSSAFICTASNDEARSLSITASIPCNLFGST
jgi:hypothetical protein